MRPGATMAEGTPGAGAAERLERLLHILPAASHKGGARLDDLARALDVDVGTVLDDLTEVTARSYYHPAGSGDDIQITVDPERVQVWTTGAFKRPVRLSPLEAFCLALGLRGRALEDGSAGGTEGGGRPGGGGFRESLLRRAERHLAAAPPPREAVEGVVATDTRPDPDGVRELLVACARDRMRCRIRYLKPGDGAPEARVVHPHAVAHAEGRWYALAWCETAEDVRVFRLDRILDGEACGGRFQRRDAGEVEAFLDGGRVYHADSETEVAVRYSPAVARWVREWAEDAAYGDDGSVLVRHRVADPGWVVRHVVAYGGEAEVVEPEGLREAVRAHSSLRREIFRDAAPRERSES